MAGPGYTQDMTAVKTAASWARTPVRTDRPERCRMYEAETADAGIGILERRHHAGNPLRSIVIAMVAWPAKVWPLLALGHV
jgi:hypothetical protein